jgi:hypothetical protein
MRLVGVKKLQLTTGRFGRTGNRDLCGINSQLVDELHQQ